MGEGGSLTEDNGMVYNLLQRENCRQTLRFTPMRPGGDGMPIIVETRFRALSRCYPAGRDSNE
ncbi:MAG: hypothetical protein D6681_15895 [Calditrichaeota bacterium]|nr:MAG: hypothetical protein D6681_15895 [Calditrichota bacterium]